MCMVKAIDGTWVRKRAKDFVYMPAADEYQGFVGRHFVRIRPEDWNNPKNCKAVVADRGDAKF